MGYYFDPSNKGYVISIFYINLLCFINNVIYYNYFKYVLSWLCFSNEDPVMMCIILYMCVYNTIYYPGGIYTSIFNMYCFSNYGLVTHFLFNTIMILLVLS